MTVRVKVLSAVLAALLALLGYWGLTGSSLLMGDLVVVGKDIRVLGSATQTCVRYRAFGAIEETCVPITSGSTGLDCYNAAHVGERLPQPCIGR